MFYFWESLSFCGTEEHHRSYNAGAARVNENSCSPRPCAKYKAQGREAKVGKPADPPWLWRAAAKTFDALLWIIGTVINTVLLIASLCCLAIAFVAFAFSLGRLCLQAGWWWGKGALLRGFAHSCCYTSHVLFKLLHHWEVSLDFDVLLGWCRRLGCRLMPDLSSGLWRNSGIRTSH